MVCVFVMTLTSAKDAYNKLANDYDYCFKSKISRAEDAIIYAALRTQLKPGLTLDLGCGTGALLEHVNLEPEEYRGVDYAREMIMRARAKFPEHDFTVMDATRFLSFFGTETFDNVVSMFGAISYMEPMVIDRIMRVLKPGGCFFLMFYNKHYAKRKSYIINTHGLKVPFKTYSQIKGLLPAHYAYGFNFTGDIGNFLPLAWLKFGLMSSFTVGLGAIAPARALFTVVMGEKSA